MCGRYTFTKTDERELEKRFGIAEFSGIRLIPRFNIAPSQEVAAIVQQDGRNIIISLKWGLIPSWARDLKKTKPMINARIETIAEKPFFKSALKQRRCLIPADGFFEWQESSQIGQKVFRIPNYIHLLDRGLFAFAGLRDRWTSPDGEVIDTCSIITMPANSFMEPIHSRMPAILCPDDESKWLDPAQIDVSNLLSLLHSSADLQLTSYKVSRLVNSPRTDTADCILEQSNAAATP
jgi:putative SOS response-associated peptidase YedK